MESRNLGCRTLAVGNGRGSASKCSSPWRLAWGGGSRWSWRRSERDCLCCWRGARGQRFVPLAGQVKSIWGQLRLNSTVSIEDIRLTGDGIGRPKTDARESGSEAPLTTRPGIARSVFQTNVLRAPQHALGVARQGADREAAVLAGPHRHGCFHSPAGRSRRRSRRSSPGSRSPSRRSECARGFCVSG